MTDYDDDRPGMMRIHVAEERGMALCARYSVAELRNMARERDIDLSFSGGTKRGIAFYLACAGVK